MIKVWVRMDRPPGPDSQFVELEDESGHGVRAEWQEWGRYWALGPFYLAADVDAEITRRERLLDPVRDGLEDAVTGLREAVATALRHLQP
jgi:hypothetical protein